MTTKKAEVSVSGKILFSKDEISLMRFLLLYKGAERDSYGRLEPFIVRKEDELVCLNTFNEFKKSYKKDKNGNEVIVDCELEFGTEQKALLLQRFTEVTMTVQDLEYKFSCIEKLK